MEYRHFKVTGGAVRAALDRWSAKRKDQIEVRQKEKELFKADGTYANQREVAGLVFDPGKPPEGWKLVRGQSSIYKPDGKTKSGKEILTRWRDMGLVDAEDFQNEVFNNGKGNGLHFMASLSIYYMTFEFIGEQLILKVPKIDKHKLEGEDGSWKSPDEHCVELKQSEYWHLKEALVPSLPEPRQS